MYVRTYVCMYVCMTDYSWGDPPSSIWTPRTVECILDRQKSKLGPRKKNTDQAVLSNVTQQQQHHSKAQLKNFPSGVNTTTGLNNITTSGSNGN